MGSVGAINTIMSKIDKVKFTEGVSIDGGPAYTAVVPEVGEGLIYKELIYKDKQFWNVIVAKYDRSKQLEIIDTGTGLGIDHTNTEQEAKDLVKEWLKAIAKGQA